jgi:DNA-binding GntR family transcriptional regulator
MEAIRATLDQGEAAIARNDTRALAMMDEAFHVAVASASHNRVLAKMVTTLHHQTARFWLVTMREPSIEESRLALVQHRVLADAIAARDVAKAQALMREALGDFPADIKRAWKT